MTTQPVRQFFSFPDPVNEIAVRVTAPGVALMALAAVVLHRPEPLILLTYGFVARAAAGPRISPLALLSTRVIMPRLGLTPRLVPGPPKRFAQALGATVSALTLVSYYAFGWHVVAFALAVVMVVLATLESTLGFCVGCKIHAGLVRRRLISSVECVECADVSLFARVGR